MLRNIPYASSIQESLPFNSSFEVEYFFNGRGKSIMVKPILINAVVIFLVQTPESAESMALVYNKKDAWSDIERESTGITEAIGAAIERYYSTCYLPWPDSHGEAHSGNLLGDQRLN